jgi:2-polyprenyl-6-hydroxyphenyl methylase/3-demethylubiquinone-9 3-methyltransferase
MSPDRPLADAARSIEAGLLPEHGPRSIHAHVTRPIVQHLVDAHAHTVLDLGCGDGWFTGALHRCGYDVMGADRDEQKLAFAREHYPHVPFLHLDATEPVRADFALLFDAVVAIDVIDHVAQPRRLLDAAIGLVKPGGLLVITAPYQGYAKNLALALTGRFDTRWEPLAEHGRMKFFSRETFGALLGEFELDDVCIRTVGRIPMFARSMIATARSPT